MDLLYNILFLIIWICFGTIIVYLRASFKYENKKNIDECIKERKKIQEKNINLEHQIKDLNSDIKTLKKELENSKKEVFEKNKYISEDKVILERLKDVKWLSDQISEILNSYDTQAIERLLKEAQKAKEKINPTKEEEKDNKTENKKWRV